MRDECTHCGTPKSDDYVCCAWAENDALRARLAEADAAVRAFVAWLEHDDSKPAYPPGTNRDSPGNEEIWRAWWSEAQDKCATALSLGRAYVRNADNGDERHG